MVYDAVSTATTVDTIVDPDPVLGRHGVIIMQVSKRHIVSMLRDRGVDQARGLEALLPELVDVERDRRPLELLGIGRGDLLKQYGDDGTVLVRRHDAPTPAECGQVGGKPTAASASHRSRLTQRRQHHDEP